MDNEQLELLIKRLIDRRQASQEGSQEYNAIVEQLGALVEKHEDAALIIEEYNSQPED